MSKQRDRILTEVFQYVVRRKEALTFEEKYQAVLAFLAYLKQHDNETMNYIHRFYQIAIHSDLDLEALKAKNLDVRTSKMSDLS